MEIQPSMTYVSWLHISHRRLPPLPCIHSGLLPTVDPGPICDHIYQKNKWGKAKNKKEKKKKKKEKRKRNGEERKGEESCLKESKEAKPYF